MAKPKEHKEKPSKSKNVESLKKESYWMYLAVKYRWYFLVIAILLMLPNFWIIPLIIAIIGIIRYLEMKG